MTIDTRRLRADLGALGRDCRALKDLLGETWTRPMADEQRRLARLRWRVTELCVLRAWTRRRLHVSRPPRHGAPPERPEAWDREAWHARIAERVQKDYEVPTLNADTPLAANAPTLAGAR
jgi:hypothetical protein